MKKTIITLFGIAMVAIAIPFLPGCGEYERGDKSSGNKQVNQACSGPGDCASGLFCNMRTGTNGQVCLPSHCENAVKDGDETGVDCGGSCNEAYRCANSLPCSVGRDCISGKCSGGYCAVLENGESCEFDLACRSQVCNHTTGKCEGGGPPPNSCSSSTECSNYTKVCDGSHTCRNCVSDGECNEGRTGYTCNAGTCTPATSVEPLCGIANTSTTGTCYGFPPATGGATPATTISFTAGVEACCPVDYDGSFVVATTVSGTCTKAGKSNAGTAFGTLSTGAYGCQRK